MYEYRHALISNSYRMCEVEGVNSISQLWIMLGS